MVSVYVDYDCDVLVFLTQVVDSFSECELCDILVSLGMSVYVENPQILAKALKIPKGGIENPQHKK